MKYLLDRLKEPSTYAGLAAVVLGAGQLGKIDEAPSVAGAIMDGAAAMQVDPIMGGLTILGGILAALLRDRGGR
ncbi:hypothetical protein [Oceanibaculum indicum]|uniref:Putative secreted protein with PEP-CTERM sorting signal n=1 Tax=Oceanibaculum indicum TaxID=526216 RepID=A0A420WQE8_9PROT|nr:hypothetical protein [Oceanibaculum indicum]RKQ73115.1 putative secreted protein with PEP-CTERM sorting signal [Oceanibaculum indicum]